MAVHESAVLLLNHVRDRWLVELYETLVDHCGASYHVSLLSDRTQASTYLARLPRSARELAFTTKDLLELGYPGKSDTIQQRSGPRNMKLGNAELPVLLFFRSNPHYEYYWVVEYDVRFTGCWKDLFDAFDSSQSDLLGTSLIYRHQLPQWSHWPSVSIEGQDAGDRDSWIKGFFPAYRLSARALRVMDKAYARGATGHMEGLMPTVIANAGLSIEDLGGSGPFVAPGNENRFYTNNPFSNLLSPGTFVYRPIRERPGSEPGKLWHPVKPREPKPLYLARRLASRLSAALG